MTALTSLYLLVGTMSSVRSNNNFPFQDIIDKKILLWDEPSYDSYYQNQLKEILGG